jgi:ABC-type antimicrobial peptide transport system permease subunit
VSGIQPMRACPAPRGSPQAVTVAYAITPATVTVRGMQILAGRDFDQHDIAAGRPVAMVSRGFAERFLGGDRAIGESLWPCGTGPARTVVGVVDDRAIFPRNPVLPTVYVPYSQAAGLTTGTTVTFAALAQTTPHDIAGDLRALVSRIGVPVFAIENGVERRERVIARDRTLSHLLTLIGVCALLLAALGTYGVLAYFVRRRTSELGIRMVLGAAPRAVMALVVRQSIPSVATGVLVGVVAARVGRTWLASQLAGVSTWSARAAMTASVVVIGTALAAAAIPAFRAARIDPSRAVRIE